MTRLFIQDCRFLAVGHGDCRDFTTDVKASSRSVIAWDTNTGEVSITASESCIDMVKPIPSALPSTLCNAARAIGEGNDLKIKQASAQGGNSARLQFDYKATNSLVPFGAISGEGTFEIGSNGTVYSQITGTKYPSVEMYQYRSGEPPRNLGFDQQSFTYKNSWVIGQVGPLAGLNMGNDRMIAFNNGEPTCHPDIMCLARGDLY